MTWEDELKDHRGFADNGLSAAPAPPKEKRGSLFRIPFRSKSSTPRDQSVSTRASSMSSAVEAPKTKPRTRSKLQKKAPPKKGSSGRLVKQAASSSSNGYSDYPRVRLGDGYERDLQTGEVVDHTEMLHTLADTGQPDHRATFVRLGEEDDGTEDGQIIVDKLTRAVWMLIIEILDMADRAAFSLSCHAFQRLAGETPLRELALPDETHGRQKLSFLPRLDRRFPNHLLCFDCGVYHLRTQRGEESLKPTNILNPVYNCANISNPQKIYPRIRLTFGRALPFTFVQLVMRAHRFSLDYGITPDSLSRQYKDRDYVGTWSHQTRFVIVKGHLLMRVTSQTFAPPGLPPSGERHLLYSQEENFVPFFSVCPHWRDGVLMPSVKCAIRHIPKPLEGSGVNRLVNEIKQRQHPENPVVSLCTECRPIRRCPNCPTEYMIEVKMTEDRSDPTKLFKHALVVTRWSDLGEGTSPFNPEWMACCGGEEGYESFRNIGSRAVSGQFEAEVNRDVIPLQTLKSLNPEKKYLGEKGHDWY